MIGRALSLGGIGLIVLGGLAVFGLGVTFSLAQYVTGDEAPFEPWKAILLGIFLFVPALAHGLLLAYGKKAAVWHDREDMMGLLAFGSYMTAAFGFIVSAISVFLGGLNPVILVLLVGYASIVLRFFNNTHHWFGKPSA